MLTTLKNSLAYRLPLVYRYLSRSKRIAPGAPKKVGNLTVVMMTGKNFTAMTRLSLLSIAKNWDTLPNLVVCSDGSLSAESIKRSLAIWPHNFQVQTWDSLARHHLQKKRNALVNYANAHPFGKKLASILYNAENGPVLWVDSDVIFFKDFSAYLPAYVSGFACGGSEDFIAAYHEPVLKLFNNDLYRLYKFNAGILFVAGATIYEDFKLEEVISAISPDFDFCTEQTIFAHIASKSLGVIWPADVIMNFNHDNQQLKKMTVTANSVARHYTSNVRHLFWRDAFFHL